MAAGGCQIDPLVVEALTGGSRDSSALDVLTTREREILGDIAEGANNQAIADRRVLTSRAVEKHASAIFQKLGLTEDGDANRRVRAVLIYLAEDGGLSGRRRTSAGSSRPGSLVSRRERRPTATSPFVHSAILRGGRRGVDTSPFAVAAELHVRFPGRVLGGLLVAVGCAYFVRSLAAIDSPMTYAAGARDRPVQRAAARVADARVPLGTLPRPWSRAIVVAGSLSIVLLWFRRSPRRARSRPSGAVLTVHVTAPPTACSSPARLRRAKRSRRSSGFAPPRSCSPRPASSR